MPATESTNLASEAIECSRLLIERFDRFKERRVSLMLVEAEGKMISRSVRGEADIWQDRLAGQIIGAICVDGHRDRGHGCEVLAKLSKSALIGCLQVRSESEL